MRKKVVFGVLAFLLVVIVAIVISVTLLYRNIFHFGNLGFLSLRDDYAWDVNWERAEKFQEITGKYPTFLGKVIIVLRPGIKQTEMYMSAPKDPEKIYLFGFSEDDFVDLYFGEWGKMGPFDVLNIYPIPEGVQVVEGYDVMRPNSILSDFMRIHFAQKFNYPDSMQKDLNSLIRDEKGYSDYIFGIIKK